eukprot:scaffold56400_cov52-Phaeocystis_antarctica.AAC.2
MSAHTLRRRRSSSSSAIHVGGITPGAVPVMTAARGRHCGCAQSKAAGEKARTERQRQQSTLSSTGDRIRNVMLLHDRHQGGGYSHPWFHNGARTNFSTVRNVFTVSL